MEKLNQIIESMALAQFKAETQGTEKRNAFMLQHAELGEFMKFFNTREAGNGEVYAIRYHDIKLGSMQGLTETFIREVLWPKMKDSYIESVVKGLENKLESTYKITIEQL
jgi:fructose-1,6-bisphosphatase